MHRKAFTLAEVLITIGVIGVVAAITLPNVIAKYQKKILVTQLKKDVNFVLNTFISVFGEEGVDKISNSSLFHGMFDTSMPRFQATSLRKYIEGQELNQDSDFAKFAIEHGGASTNSWDPSIFLMLKDGSCISFSTGQVNQDFSNSLYLATVTLDVNCNKGPNEAGRDRYKIYINDFGKIYIPSSYNCWASNPQQKEDKLNDLAGALGISRKELEELLKNEGVDLASSGNTECFYKILEDNWEMNY